MSTGRFGERGQRPLQIVEKQGGAGGGKVVTCGRFGESVQQPLQRHLCASVTAKKPSQLPLSCSAVFPRKMIKHVVLEISRADVSVRVSASAGSANGRVSPSKPGQQHIQFPGPGPLPARRGVHRRRAAMLRRVIETLAHGAPRTSFLTFGDRVRIEMLDAGGQSIFGAIEQTVALAPSLV